ncbi:MAG: phage tail protein [Flavobacteriaceae bacterium]
MKKLLISLLFLQLTFAQTRVTSSGISVQGIARNEDNSPLVNNSNIEIDIKFYTIVGNDKNYIINKTGIIRTDEFGVFSYVVDIDESDYTLLKNFDVYLEIGKDPSIYVDEKLLTVPYAVQAVNANNGVKTGTIIYFAGSEVPQGWLLCDGSTFPDNQYHSALKEILGTNSTPDLRAIYLRGAGVSGTQTVPGRPTSYYNAGSLRTFHIDRIKGHKHIFNSLTGSPNDDQDTNNWTGDKVLSPGGFEFQYFLQRVQENVISGTGGARKVADGATTGRVEADNGWFLWNWNYDAQMPYAFSNGTGYIISVDPHQHRVYGKTWLQPFDTPSDTSWAMPPPAKENETAPVWYAANYIIKI